MWNDFNQQQHHTGTVAYYGDDDDDVVDAEHHYLFRGYVLSLVLVFCPSYTSPTVVKYNCPLYYSYTILCKSVSRTHTLHANSLSVLSFFLSLFLLLVIGFDRMDGQIRVQLECWRWRTVNGCGGVSVWVSEWVRHITWHKWNVLAFYLFEFKIQMNKWRSKNHHWPDWTELNWIE